MLRLSKSVQQLRVKHANRSNPAKNGVEEGAADRILQPNRAYLLFL
jgi:hypothetical protein